MGNTISKVYVDKKVQENLEKARIWHEISNLQSTKRKLKGKLPCDRVREFWKQMDEEESKAKYWSFLQI